MIRADLAAVVRVAESQIGYQERPTNRTKYGRWYGMDGVAWCAIFMSWVFWHAGHPLPRIATAKGFAYVPDVVAYAKRHGQWRSASVRPEPGWLVVFSMGGRRPDHVGIVARVLPDGRVETVEGNTNGAGSRSGGAVLRKRRKARIIGYVAVVDVGSVTPPPYTPPAAKSEPPPEVEPEEDEVAYYRAKPSGAVFRVGASTFEHLDRPTWAAEEFLRGAKAVEVSDADFMRFVDSLGLIDAKGLRS